MMEPSSSGGSDVSLNSEKSKRSSGSGLADTDAIYGRMVDLVVVFCGDCKQKINNSPAEIEKHFNVDHPSSARCVYCREKVFRYVYQYARNKPTEIVYHRCGPRSRVKKFVIG